MTKADVQKLLDLPVDERAELARQLIDSLPAAPIPEWHLDVLRQRITEADANPDAGIPWEQVEAELWPEG